MDHKPIDAAMAGKVLSPWIPYGRLRRVIFYSLIALAMFGLYFTQNYLFLLALLMAVVMSPRLVGEFAFVLGRISRLFG